MRLCALGFAVLLGGCGSTYSYYAPTPEAAVRDAPAVVDGQQAAAYQVPVDGDHRGEVRVAIVGVERISTSGTWQAQAVHVRMIVHNDDGGIWTVQPFDQVAQLDRTHRVKPVYSITDGSAGITTVVVFPGDTRTVELYYEVPEELSVKKLAEVRIQWQVATPDRVIAREDTPFERRALTRPAPTPKLQAKR
jgi:hypothetical protein